jgi:UPF0755 protein
MTNKQKLFLIGSPFLAIILVALRVYYSLAVWTYNGPDYQFDILPGENFSKINTKLSHEKIISSPRLFHRLSQYKGVMNKFKTGRYIIKSHSTMLDVYNTLINEKSMALFFTVPEGKNMYEIGHMLEDHQITTYAEFLKAARDEVILKEEGIDADSAEGYLYPETYDFLPNIPAKTVVHSMIHQFKKKMSTLNNVQSKFTPTELIILASMVEKETGDKKERPMIAGVFLNRLKINMRLQSDPTTVYGIFEKYNGNITRKDLLTPSDYNTYTLPALPKGPICNPGIDAIRAVLNPAQHKFLYFVSQNDGTHIFSENYEAHQKAVETWQKNAKNRDGRSWRNHKN